MFSDMVRAAEGAEATDANPAGRGAEEILEIVAAEGIEEMPQRDPLASSLNVRMRRYFYE